MKVYLIRLKDHPELYVGKKNVSYALDSDYIIAENKINPAKSSFLVPKAKAKIWQVAGRIKWLHSYSGRYYDHKNHEDCQSTFSLYEVEIDDNGKLSWMPLDEFVKTVKDS